VLLGDDSNVTNFGVSGSTVILTSVKPYRFQDADQAARAFLPTTVIVMLGTNDARSDVYPDMERFVADYERLISKFQALKSNPQIFLVKPPPILNNDLNISCSDFLDGVIPAIEQVANETGLPLIDVYTPLLNHPEYFVDGVHLNAEGGEVVANLIAQTITAPVET
jgi:lysophospholipase L1-like esterase